ncbi:MAG TPA: AI-2E family transporter [Gemmatimonadaceae bacterium]|nr:AI-2E family transporter [Gemmatimonadaceae bacterium]
MQPIHAPQTRAALLIVIAGVAILVLVAPYMVGLLSAAVLYVICKPSYEQLVRWVRFKHLAAAITLMGTILIIVLPIVVLVGMVVDQAPDALRAARGAALLDKLATLRIGRVNVGAEIVRASGTITQWFSRQAMTILGGAAQATLTLLIAFFGLYYLLLSGSDTWARFRGYLPFAPSSADELRDRFFSVTRATLIGTFFVALMQGVIIGIGFWLVRLPGAAFWGVLAGFASILPVIGSSLVWVPGVLILLVQGRYGGALILAAISILVASNIDNVIRAIVYKRVSNIHPMITLVGAFAGVKYFGLLGVLLGPLAIEYFLELVRLYQKDYIQPQIVVAPAPVGAAPATPAPQISPAAGD